MKTCNRCGLSKALEDYYSNGQGYVNSYCKKCQVLIGKEWRSKNRERHNATTRAWRKATPEKQKSIELKCRYGLTIEEYQAMVDSQLGQCAFKSCERPIEHIDHDHCNGKVRGLLCGLHNKGLGCFRDDPELLRAAADYVEYWRHEHGK